MSKDLFSKQASTYAKYRPGYPQELIDYILSFVDNRENAWDCATGNGQAALLLAPYFKKIFATDISEKQIDYATAHPSIVYSLSPAEKTSFDDNFFDLVTVAQAYHWFKFETFFKEAGRICKPGAVIAVWGYSLLKSADKKIDEAIRKFYFETINTYWDAERKYVDEGYKTIPFYFDELPAKDFKEDVQWKLEDIIGYLNSWSSVQHFIRANQYNPVDVFESGLRAVWDDGSAKSFSFPIFLRIGRVIKP